MNVLGQQDGEIFNFHFGVNPNGNAPADPHGEFIGKNIIYVKSSLENTAKHFGKTVAEVQAVIQRSKKKLFDVRKGRPRPHLDDKILTDWNGLMISSLAFGSRILREPRYQEAAEKSAQFILEHLVNQEGRLLHRYRDGEAAIAGTIEDYAFFIHGLLDLYEATFRTEYLKQALRLAGDMVRLFWDPAGGGFYFTAQDAEELLFRQREIYDGAVPSGNSMAALDLVRLYHLSFQKHWEEKLTELFDAFSLKIHSMPSAYAQMLSALDFAIGPSQEIVLASTNGNSGLDAVCDEIYARFLPNKVVLLRTVSGKEAGDIVTIAPFVENQRPVNGKLTVYVCENHVCRLPVSDAVKLREILDGLKPVR